MHSTYSFTRRTMVVASAAISLGLLPLAASAQTAYPNKPIKFVVPYSAGGLPDTVARIFAQRLTERTLALNESIFDRHLHNRSGCDDCADPPTRARFTDTLGLQGFRQSHRKAPA